MELFNFSQRYCSQPRDSVTVVIDGLSLQPYYLACWFVAKWPKTVYSVDNLIMKTVLYFHMQSNTFQYMEMSA